MSHLGDRAGPGTQIALGRQLRIAFDDRPAGDAELPGQRPRRRQPLAGSQPPVPDGLSQRIFERRAAAAVGRQLEM